MITEVLLWFAHGLPRLPRLVFHWTFCPVSRHATNPSGHGMICHLCGHTWLPDDMDW